MSALTPNLERRLLQMTIAVAGLVPVGAGLTGGLFGASLIDQTGAGVSLDSHVRYLSGLLLGIGLAYWQTIPTIEQKTDRVRLLTAIVFLGGVMRLIGIWTHAAPGPAMFFGLGMELVVTPAICLWQGRLATNLSDRSRETR